VGQDHLREKNQLRDANNPILPAESPPSMCKQWLGALCVEERWIITQAMARKTLDGPHIPTISAIFLGMADSLW